MCSRCPYDFYIFIMHMPLLCYSFRFTVIRIDSLKINETIYWIGGISQPERSYLITSAVSQLLFRRNVNMFSLCVIVTIHRLHQALTCPVQSFRIVSISSMLKRIFLANPLCIDRSDEHMNFSTVSYDHRGCTRLDILNCLSNLKMSHYYRNRECTRKSI